MLEGQINRSNLHVCNILIFMRNGTLIIKWTVRVISSDSPCKNENSRFTTVLTVPLKDLSYQV